MKTPEKPPRKRVWREEDRVTTRICLRLPPDIASRIKVMAENKGTDMSDIVSLAFLTYEKKGAPKGTQKI